MYVKLRGERQSKITQEEIVPQFLQLRGKKESKKESWYAERSGMGMKKRVYYLRCLIKSQQ